MSTNRQKAEMEVPEASNEVEIKQEPEQGLQTNIPVVSLWAMGSLKCNHCDFRTKYKSLLTDHRDIHKHLPQIQQQSSSSIPKWAMGGLKCGQCNFTTKYKTILEYHQQTEMHVIMNTFPPWHSPGFEHEKQTSKQPLIKQRKVKHPEQTQQKRFNGKSFASIIMKAIQSSEKKMATLQEIYSYFDKHYLHKQKRQGATQNQIRYTLSLYKCFYQNAQTPRLKPAGHRTGRYWQFNPDAGMTRADQGPGRRRTIEGAVLDTGKTDTWY